MVSFVYTPNLLYLVIYSKRFQKTFCAKLPLEEEFDYCSLFTNNNVIKRLFQTIFLLSEKFKKKVTNECYSIMSPNLPTIATPPVKC